MMTKNAERKLRDGRPDGGSPLFPGDAARRPASPAYAGEIDAEIARARRHGHDLSIAVLTVRPHTHEARPGLDYWARETPMSGDLALAAALAVGETLREDDVVCYQARQRRLVVALPHADVDGARAALRRVKAHSNSGWHLQMRGGVAQLARDAMTLDWLVAVAAARLVDGTCEAIDDGPARVDGQRERRKARPRPRTSGAGGAHGDAA